MKNTSKIVLSLSIVTGLLAIGQASYATPGQTSKLEKITFMANASEAAECKAPTAFKFTYMHDHMSGQRTLKPDASAGIKWAVVEDSEKLGHTADYVNTFVFASNVGYPLHIHGHFNHDDHSNKGVYWFYTQNGNRCSGNFTIKDLAR